ncbi:MAG TPA: DUF6537 domain-containing protein, partial [Stellaceae bacterium]|nr:DUF6537 domain-containing protein [Stellaceae bacterium]
ERRTERQLIGEYQDVIEEILAHLTPANHATAVELAALPLEIRGFGHIKQASILRVKAKEEALLARFRLAPSPHVLAAE